MRIQAIASLALVGVAGAALAQDASDDWEVIRQPDRDSVFAFIPTTTGLTIGFRCIDGVYGGLVAGLPEASRGSRIRTLRIAVGEEEAHDWTWSVTTDRTVALADYPASLARALRDGGAVSIVIPGGAGEGRNLRHELELPASSAAIDETLAACDRPTEDPRDALLPDIAEDGLPAGVNWARAPRPSYPRTNYSEGFAVVTCVVQPDGAITQCQIESEHPNDGGFGRNALRATDDARITSPGETLGQYAPRIIGFRVNYHGG
jgi:TonB family protein